MQRTPSHGLSGDLRREDPEAPPSVFITILPGYAPGNGQVVSGWGSGTIGSLKHTYHWPLDNRAFELPTPCYLAENGSSKRFAFSGALRSASNPQVSTVRGIY